MAQTGLLFSYFVDVVMKVNTFSFLCDGQVTSIVQTPSNGTCRCFGFSTDAIFICSRLKIRTPRKNIILAIRFKFLTTYFKHSHFYIFMHIIE